MKDMKANPVHNRTGRKKRASTLPGVGMSASERVRRTNSLRGLNSSLASENIDDAGNVFYGLGITYTMDEHMYGRQPRIVDRTLKELPTATIQKIERVYKEHESGSGLGEIIAEVMEPGGTWMILFGHDREEALLDVISYRAHLGNRSHSSYLGTLPGRIDERTAHNFKEVYRITGQRPGTLPKYGEAGRTSFEALLLAVCMNGVFTGRTFVGATISPKFLNLGGQFPTFPEAYAKQIINKPELAEPFIEFAASQMLLAEEVNWDDFIHYAETAPSLREGVL